MSIYILGPFIDSVTEPTPTVAAPAGAVRRGIALAAVPTEPGGKVNFSLEPHPNDTDPRPTAVYAAYVSPPEQVPPAGSRTPEWFMSGAHPLGSVVVSQPPVDPGPMTITVPGVKPGVHFVQTILEYPGESP